MLMPSLFDEFFDDFARPAKSVVRYNYPANAVMKTDVKEDENGYHLDIELPGYKKDDIKAELKEGYMTITATKAENKDEADKKGNYIRRERYQGTSSRSFYVGEEVKEEDIKAKFEDGILKVFVPKIEAVPEVPETKFIAIEG
ncbi:MAG: Hsp20/alpha crystallin family protein [Lachnospiraceae bacterium]|nr:Hsp20/alpha crystallin family protein [Lachnospiraceae bacterium]